MTPLPPSVESALLRAMAIDYRRTRRDVYAVLDGTPRTWEPIDGPMLAALADALDHGEPSTRSALYQLLDAHRWTSPETLRDRADRLDSSPLTNETETP